MPSSRRLRLALAAALVPLLLLTLAAVAVLASPRVPVDLPAGLGPAGDLVEAQLLSREVVPCPTDEGPSVVPLPTLPEDQATSADATRCVSALVRLTSGPDAGQEVRLEVLSLPLRPFPSEGGVLLAPQPGAGPDGGTAYVFTDVQRDRPLLLLAAAFAVAVLLLGRWAGLRSLVGLALGLLVVALFVLPALLAGRNAVAVALAGSFLVVLVTLPLAHGLTVQTAVAVLGTAASLLLTVGLAHVAVPLTRLTGTEAEGTELLVGVVEGVDLQGLLLAGIVVGALGVLDDVTVTQAATVWELHRADPTPSARALWAAGLRVGRHHVGATVNTLALAYVGASLPLFVVFSLVGTDPGDAAVREVVAQELVRALVGGIGIVAAVPLTTGLAALAVRHDVPGAPVTAGTGR